jgi:hypothetical protein
MKSKTILEKAFSFYRSHFCSEVVFASKKIKKYPFLEEYIFFKFNFRPDPAAICGSPPLAPRVVSVPCCLPFA